jgi:N-sulfoglucosamine sulfohydrolase
MGTIKRIVVGLLGLVFALCTSSCSSDESVKTPPPNIVFFLADDLTYWDIGCYGSVNARTPNINQLAREGMLFARFYQAVPMSSPTRHNLYTGIYPVRSGAYPNQTFVYPDTKTIIDYLEPAGYRVALSGKRDIGPEKVFRFEYLGEEDNPNFPLVDMFIEDAVRHREPFLLFLCSNEPHTPWELGQAARYDPKRLILPGNWVDTPETRKAYARYLAEVEFLDGQFGEAINILKKYGIQDNTIVIFSSEHGSAFPFAKWTCYEAGLRTAFIVKYPGVVKPGTVSHALADYNDVVPTLIELAGAEVPSGLDGLSLNAVLLGETEEHKDFSFGMQTSRGIIDGLEQYAIRTVTDGEYRLILNLNHSKRYKNEITEKEQAYDYWHSWKRASLKSSFAWQQVNAYRYRAPIEFFDVINDPGNMVNLANDPYYAQRIIQMRKALDEWMIYCGDQGVDTELNAEKRMVLPQ